LSIKTDQNSNEPKEELENETNLENTNNDTVEVAPQETKEEEIQVVQQENEQEDINENFEMSFNKRKDNTQVKTAVIDQPSEFDYPKFNENPNDNMKHVVRYKVTSPKPVQVNNRFYDAPPISPIKRKDISGPTYIDERVRVTITPEKIVRSSPNVTKGSITVNKGSPRVYTKRSYPNANKNNGTYNVNGKNYRVIRDTNHEDRNEERFTSSSPINNFQPVSNQSEILKRGTPYTIVQGDSINRHTMPSKTERDQIYSRRFKHLKLVEQTKDYKRFQYTTKSREKVSWSWKRTGKPNTYIEKSNEKTH
jgi:hypothetical protein